ncbi:MAG: HesA/MoeB/ThiF family protein [Clostridia bacterium]|nr:HesA/MoeB/ThiF family protein [Clostridia bacterium]
MAFSKEELSRYSRHFVLPEIGVIGQKKLLSSSVLVIGAGALGSASLMYLAAAGVGMIGVADFDRVELSNLQRQIIHNTKSVGEYKTESAKRALNAINPGVEVVRVNQRLDADNIIPIIADYDFILDCTDRFSTKFLINDACVIAKKPFSHAGVIKFGGQSITYVPGEGPCLRCILGAPPKDEGLTCSTAGVLGAATGLMGCVQASEAVKYITGAGGLLLGKVFSFDLLTPKFRVYDGFEHSDECRVCNGAEASFLTGNRAEYEDDCEG